MDISGLERLGEDAWRIPASGRMRVPAVIYADDVLVREMDEKVREQIVNVAGLPGIVEAAYAMPDAHWGYGFPIGGVAAFDPDEGVVSAGGVGFDISCGVRTLVTGLPRPAVEAVATELADALFDTIPAGMGATGGVSLDDDEMNAMLAGGAAWAVERGWGAAADLPRIEEGGRMADADPDAVSPLAKQRQRDEMGTLGSGNHYLEAQEVTAIDDAPLAAAFGLKTGDVVVSIHCGSRGLGHQIGSEFLREMAVAAPAAGIELPDLELACAPIRSELGRRYLRAMRAAINCALANRQILTHLTRGVFGRFFPDLPMPLLFDVSHNTCKEEWHTVAGRRRQLYVHRKGATRALPPDHPDLPNAFVATGQPVFVGGSMGTGSAILAGVPGAPTAFASACHGAGRRMSRHQALKLWRGREVVDALARRGVFVRSRSLRGVAEEAPDAYKPIDAVVDAAVAAGLARRVARLKPILCIKG